jgi:hypothetical protein
MTEPEKLEKKLNMTIDELNTAIGKVLLMRDKCVVRLISYTLIANAMRLGPVWSLIVAPPSGGKSELIQATYDLDVVFPLSSLTSNTFISGMRSAQGSTSLLDELDSKTLVMKDLTTIVEMNQDERRAILSQLREIYDRRFSKAFGTGERKYWEGHMGFLAAITNKGAEVFGSRGAMGERFILYQFEQPDRMAVLSRAFENGAVDFEILQMNMREAFNTFMEPRLEDVENFDPKIRVALHSNKKLEEVIKNITDLATQARSTVERDYHTGKILYVHPLEMPTRFALQLTAIGSAAIYSHTFDPVPSMTLDPLDIKLLTDIAWGSIPPQRAAVLELLAQYKDGATKDIAAKLGYETDVVREWLSDLAALKMISRNGTRGSSGDVWVCEDRWRSLITEYRKITKSDISIANEAYKYDEDGNDLTAPLGVEDDEDYLARLAKEMNEATSADTIEWD